MIKRQKVDLSEERKILSYMITSTSFLRELKNIAIPKLFQSSYSRIVAGWIWEYFDYTLEAPYKSIEDIYSKKKKDVHDEDDVELIGEFLYRLSSDWEKAEVHNVLYTVKNAIEFFKLRSLDVLKNNIDFAVQNKDIQAGERLVSEYKKIDRINGSGVSLLDDKNSIIQAFSHENEYLFSFPGALGKFIGPFMRSDFFAIMGAMKKGKTHYLWYTGYRAMLMGLKVVFISLEMSEQQMLRRMWQTMVGQPIETNLIKMPYFRQQENGLYEINFREKRLKSLDLNEIENKQKLYRQSIRTGDIKLITYPSFGADLNTIETELINLEYYEGYVPDVLIIDYADILRPSNDRMEYRHQLDVTWKALRGLAQKRSMLVVTGTQTSRQGMTRDVKAVDVAEDYRKLAHVTKMISLNQNEKEREDGIMRIESVVQREGKMSVGQIVVLQCYSIGRPYMDSKIKGEVDMKRYEQVDKKR